MLAMKNPKGSRYRSQTHTLLLRTEVTNKIDDKMNILNNNLVNPDDSFFYDNQTGMVTNLNQTQDGINGYSTTYKKSRKQKFIDYQSESPTKQNSKQVIPQNKLRVMTQPAGNFNFKSKVKKRLKFTMRNEKSISTKIYQKPLKNNKMSDLQNIVSIVAIQGSNSNVNTSHEVGHSECKNFNCMVYSRK